MEHDILIGEDGTLTFVYADDLAPLMDVGEARTSRASHVEPHPTRPGWYADMRPSGGPILGDGTVLDSWHNIEKGMHFFVTPFVTREAALAAEREWLRQEKDL